MSVAREQLSAPQQIPGDFTRRKDERGKEKHGSPERSLQPPCAPIFREHGRKKHDERGEGGNKKAGGANRPHWQKTQKLDDRFHKVLLGNARSSVKAGLARRQTATVIKRQKSWCCKDATPYAAFLAA